MLRLAWAYLAARPLLTAMHVVLLAVGVATIVVALLFTGQTEKRLERDAQSVDLVVGAKGSPLQLILSSVLHVDVPTGNIPYAEAKALAADPMIRSATPISLGDSFRSFRIVGTDATFLDLYSIRVGEGRAFEAPMEAVLGPLVARRTGLGVGATFTGAHGIAEAGGAALHGEHPYKVVGILAPSGTVADRLVLTSIASVWQVHEAHPRESAPGPQKGHAKEAHDGPGDEEREVTSVLLRYRTPIAAAQLPRRINASTAMQAASPAYEGARLMNLVGVGVDALRIFAIVLIGAAALSVFIALTSALQERRYDLALLRALGARPARLFTLIVAEGVTLVVAGVILGLALGHAVAGALGTWLARSRNWSVSGLAWEPAEAWLVLLVLAAGVATCLVPAIQAYRRDPATVLLER